MPTVRDLAAQTFSSIAMRSSVVEDVAGLLIVLHSVSLRS
jgi:hypothetical protein